MINSFMKGMDTLKSLILITITRIRAKTTSNPDEIAMLPGTIPETGIKIVIVSKSVFANIITNA